MFGPNCRAFVCLHMLPFEFLIPTLYAKQFKLGLNVSLWVWYGANVWNSVSCLGIIYIYIDFVSWIGHISLCCKPFKCY